MSAGLPPLNPWEAQALNHNFPEQAAPEDGTPTANGTWSQYQDPVIYPGLYSGSGLDVMGILLQVVSRPNPKVNLGPIDASAPLVICDLNLPDTPIIYASDAFCELTEYTMREAVGRNCRFLQTSPAGLARSSRSQPSSNTKGVDEKVVQRLGCAVRERDEAQLRITNYKKSGQPFTNLLSIIPLPPDASGCCYAVGLQSEV